MSKSKGNFKTLEQAINMYTSDSVRMTFANCVESMDDSLFDQNITNSTIITISNEQKNIKIYIDMWNESKKNTISEIDNLYKKYYA